MWRKVLSIQQQAATRIYTENIIVEIIVVIIVGIHFGHLISSNKTSGQCDGKINGNATMRSGYYIALAINNL